jgi:two-component system sensor histidine kinase SenX3
MRRNNTLLEGRPLLGKQNSPFLFRSQRVSGQLWILGCLLLVLCALGLTQYHWINQVTDAQRQTAKANLTAALSDFESDFDGEITRAVLAFQVPSPSLDYSERYRAWLRYATYPNLIRGVYTLEQKNDSFVLKPVTSEEPPIRSSDWQRDLPEFSSEGPVTTTVRGPIGLETFSAGGFIGAGFAAPNGRLTIDGNPAFLFAVMPYIPRVEPDLIQPGAAVKPSLDNREVIDMTVPDQTPVRMVVVFDLNYMTRRFLPQLMQLYFSKRLGSGYDVVVLSQDRPGPPVVIFPVPSPSTRNDFARADGEVGIFSLRPDCLLPPPSGDPSDSPLVATEVGLTRSTDFIEILTRKLSGCSTRPEVTENDLGGRWDVRVRYRAGSLDQAVASFRRRSMTLSGSVLVILAAGICALVLFAERARSLAEMQAEFVLGVSHELRTPLTVIQLAGDNLSRGLVGNSDQAHTYGKIIHTQVSELSYMIEETLAFAQMHGHSLTRDRTVVRPEQIVGDALANNETALRQAGMQVELDFATGLPAVKVDVRLITKCLDNLIRNAVKYAAAGQWLAIRIGTKTQSGSERVQISVEDRGNGIGPDELSHIFEPFYRGKHSQTSQIPGIGLGLTFVKRAVEAHDGSVEVCSAPVTRFSIFLPSHRWQEPA